MKLYIKSQNAFDNHFEFNGEYTYQEASQFADDVIEDIYTRFKVRLSRRKKSAYISLWAYDLPIDTAKQLVDTLETDYLGKLDDIHLLPSLGDLYNVYAEVNFVSNARILKNSRPDRQTALKLMEYLKSEFDVDSMIYKGTAKTVTFRLEVPLSAGEGLFDTIREYLSDLDEVIRIKDTGKNLKYHNMDVVVKKDI